MNKIHPIIASLLLLPLFILGGCNDESVGLLPNEGEVSFRFTKITTYVLGELEEIATVKITLEKDGKLIELTSLPLKGNADIIATPNVALTEGSYKIISYKAYGKDLNAIDFLDIKPEKDNTFIVVAGKTDSFDLPVLVKTVIDSTHSLYNALFALCTEVLGDDRSKWPPSWKKEENILTWRGLEFEVEEATGTILYLAGLVIDGNENLVYDSELKKMVPTGLPEFKNMKKLSRAIVNLTTLESLVIRNCALEELPENLGEMNIASLYLENTQLSKLPASTANLLHLTAVTLKGNRFTSFPEELCDIKTLQLMIIDSEPLATLPATLSNLKNLYGMTINNTQISEIPNIFDQVYKVSTLDLRYNKNLKTLPSSLNTLFVGEAGNRTRKYIRGYLLDGCGFTSIPSEILHENTKMISIPNNEITSITSEEIHKMPFLETLILNKNRLSSFPKIESNAIRMLSLIDCGLTAAQVDRSAMPNLYSRYVDDNGTERTTDFLFFSQAQYDAIFAGNLKGKINQLIYQ